MLIDVYVVGSSSNTCNDGTKVQLPSLGTGFTYSPGVFLKEKIIDNISSVQILVIGNTTREDSIKFCEENIVAKFNTVKCNHK